MVIEHNHPPLFERFRCTMSTFYWNSINKNWELYIMESSYENRIAGKKQVRFHRRNRFTKQLWWGSEENLNYCNTIVISWLTCNVSKELLGEILYSSSAHKIWLDLKEWFDKISGCRLYQLHRNIFTLTHGVFTVSAYYMKLKNLWDEYDSFLKKETIFTC